MQDLKIVAGVSKRKFAEPVSCYAKNGCSARTRARRHRSRPPICCKALLGWRASLNNLAELYRAQGRYAEAEPLYLRALTIREKALGPDHPNVATALNNLARLYYGQEDYEKAAAPFERIIAIDEKALGLDHPSLALDMENYAAVLTKLDRADEATQWSAKAKAIRAKQVNKK